MTRQDEAKITYTNGFHVNLALTKTSNVSLDEHVFRQDYTNFFRAAQPVINEEGLNPTEFTLVSGIYLVTNTYMKSRRKCTSYLGAPPTRDYSYLDSRLLNLHRDVRKKIQGYIFSN